MRSWTCQIVLLSLIALATGCGLRLSARDATENATPDETIECFLSALGRDWYGVYAGDEKMGYMWGQYVQRNTGDSVEFVVGQRTQLRYLDDHKRPTVWSFEEEMVFGEKAPYPLIRAMSVETDGHMKRRVEIVATGDTYLATIEEREGTVEERTVANLQLTLHDIVAFDLWYRQPRSIGDTARFRNLAVDELKLLTFVDVVEDIEQSIQGGKPTRKYRVSSVQQVEGLKDVHSAELVSDRGVLLFRDTGANQYRLEDEQTATAIDNVYDPFVHFDFDINRPLGNPFDITYLELDVSGPSARLLEDGQNQRVTRNTSNGTTTIKLSRDLGNPLKAERTEINDGLAETAMHRIRDPNVVSLAKEAVADARTVEEKVQQLIVFVDDYLADRDDDRTFVSVLDIIDRKAGLCLEHSILFTTLARAVGIPAREVNGLVYAGGDPPTFGAHAWNEVVIDGRWVAVDPCWREREPNLSHIRLGLSPKPEQFFNGEAKFVVRQLRHLDESGQ